MLEGGEHLEREKTRISVLICRILYVIEQIIGHSLDDIINMCHTLILQLQTCELKISSRTIDVKDCELVFNQIASLCTSLIEIISPFTPKHKPIDIQTTDAGPGVGTSEKMVRIRLTESFILNDLDMQVRFHYAPRDSKTHKVEQVMSALNDAVGDGRFIDLNRRSVMDIYTEEKILQMTPADFVKAQEKEDQEVGFRCAEKVSERYNGTSCMFTTIHFYSIGPKSKTR